MTSFFPVDYKEQAAFSCATCKISATVRGEVMESLMRVQAQRCVVRGHEVTMVNFEIDGDGS